MEKSKKKLTNAEIDVDNMVINDTKEVFYLLHKVRISRGISTVDICAKIGLSESAYYRATNNFKSQGRCSPTLKILNSLATALGYEILLVDKKNKNDEDN